MAYRASTAFAVAAPHFNENLPLRNQPPLVNTIPVALGAQHQVRTFFETDGAGVTHPTPTHLWEAPISSPLPDEMVKFCWRQPSRYSTLSFWC